MDVVPTFTTSNDRMMLLLSSGLSGMLRIEDAERLQVCVCACVYRWVSKLVGGGGGRGFGGCQVECVGKKPSCCCFFVCMCVHASPAPCGQAPQVACHHPFCLGTPESQTSPGP